MQTAHSAPPSPVLDGTFSLGDMMLMQPELHPTNLVDCKVSDLKQLRLVSKEICRSSQSAIRSCSVHLGEGGVSPKPQQLVSLLADAQLSQLKVTLTIMSAGSNASTAAEQLSICSNQMECLITELLQALSSVTKLIINVRYATESSPPGFKTSPLCQQPPQIELQSVDDRDGPEANRPVSTSSDSDIDIESDSDSITLEDHFSAVIRFPQELGSVATTVLSKLASAVPNLQVLHLRGGCWNAGLRAFGTSCPHLVTLNLDIKQVPVEVVSNLAQHLPNLTTVALGSYFLKAADQSTFNLYMDTVLLELQHCVKLISLRIDVTEFLTLTCTPRSWALLPISFQHLRCSCHISTSDEFKTLLRRLPSLCLPYPPIHGFHLLDIFQQFPLLRNLTLLVSEAVSIVCASDGSSSGTSLLKQRLLDQAFHLNSFETSFSGTCTQVRDMFAWLPAFLDVPGATIEFVGSNVQLACLERLPYVFPNLKHFALVGKMAGAVASSGNAVSQGMDMLFFKPLTLCPFLQSLSLSCANLTLTTSGLVQLCASLNLLDDLDFKACKGVDECELEEILLSLNRKVPIRISVST